MKRNSQSVIVVGAGFAGLSCAHELKKKGFSVILIEASHRVGGRVHTLRHRFFNGLHGELGAMRIPRNHALVKTYLDLCGIATRPFEQKNKIIYLSDLKAPMSYDDFETRIRLRDYGIYRFFPGMKDGEKGKTPDELWDEAIRPVKAICDELERAGHGNSDILEKITEKFDSYSLRTYLEDVAGWSPACVRFYETCSAHVVLDNGFVDSWIDSFLSSQTQGEESGMAQIVGGMDAFAWKILQHGRHPLEENIWFGLKVTEIEYNPNLVEAPIKVLAKNSDSSLSFRGDYIVFTLPCPAMKLVNVRPDFSIAKRTSLRESRYVDVIKILLQFRERWWEKALSNFKQGESGGCISDLNIRYSVFQAPPQSYKGRRGVILASYVFEDDAKGLSHCSEEEHIRIALKDLSRIFGKETVYGTFEVGSSHTWSRDAFAGGAAFCYFAKGQRSTLFKQFSEPEWDDRAYFAGEHTSTLHGWIEGALQSGTRVAGEIIQDWTLRSLR